MELKFLLNKFNLIKSNFKQMFNDKNKKNIIYFYCNFDKILYIFTKNSLLLLFFKEYFNVTKNNNFIKIIHPNKNKICIFTFVGVKKTFILKQNKKKFIESIYYDKFIVTNILLYDNNDYEKKCNLILNKYKN